MTETVQYSIAEPQPQARPWIPWIRSRVFELAVLLWSIPFGLIIITYFQVRRVPAEVRWALRLWSRGFICFARYIVGVRHHLEGVENIPDHPVVFVSNHQSYWESIAFTALFPHINVITWSGVMGIPVFGWGLREAPMIAVHRDQPGANLRRIVRDTGRNLANGRSILFFPEGHRVKPGRTRRYQRGLGLIYARSDAWIVPVVNNAGLSWADGFRTKHGGDITVRFLKPITPGGDPAKTAAQIEALFERRKRPPAEFATGLGWSWLSPFGATAFYLFSRAPKQVKLP